MKVSPRWIRPASVVAVAVLLSMTARTPIAFSQAAHIRWDIVHFTSFSPPTFEAGGFASAHANDTTTITLTGSGTFVGAGRRAPRLAGECGRRSTRAACLPEPACIRSPGSCDGKRRRARSLRDLPTSAAPQPTLTRGSYSYASSTPMETMGFSSSAAIWPLEPRTRSSRESLRRRALWTTGTV